MSVKTLNSRIICEPYKGERKIESQVKSGFSTIKQKNTIVALRVLADADINQFIKIKANSKVHISEEILYSKLSTQKPMESPVISGPFVMIDFGDVMFIEEAE